MSAKSESVEDVYERGCLVLRTAMGGWLRSETKVCMHAFVSLGAVLSEIIASMDAIVLLSAGSSEIFAFMDVIVSLGSQREWPGEGSRDLK